MATALQTALMTQARRIAADNRYHYYDRTQGESNLGPYTFDCATFNSYTIYLAMGWNDWPSSSHGSIGYFWPYISQTGFDDFLTLNGWTRYTFSDSLRTEGAIIITDETLHHSLMLLDNNEICDANNYFGYGANSIAVRSYPTYDPARFAYIYIPPDVPVPPIPPVTGVFPSSAPEDKESLEGLYMNGKLEVLQRGSTGNQVKNLQALLNLWLPSLSPLVIDGYFGAVTEYHLMVYQKAQGLTRDGICGFKTWEDILTT